MDESSDGTFYGFTQGGGRYGQGSIVRLTATGKETALASFDYWQTGERPQSLFLAKDGNRYGFTSDGGPSGWGTIFKLTPEGLLTTLFPLPDQTGGFSHPFTNATPSSLVEGDDGNLYFTASITNQSHLFQVTPQGKLTPLAEMGFFASMIGGRNGLFFGVSRKDPGSVPTIFTLKSGTVTTIFAYPRPNSGFSNVLLARDGNLYGTVVDFDPHRPYLKRFLPIDAVRGF